MRSEASQNFEGGLGDANLRSSIQTDITGKSMYTSLKNKKKLDLPKDYCRVNSIMFVVRQVCKLVSTSKGLPRLMKGRN